MPDLTLAAESFQEGVSGGVESIAQNVHIRPTPDQDGRVYEIEPVEGLDQSVSYSDNIRAIFAERDLFDGDLFTITGTSLIRFANATSGSISKPSGPDGTVAATGDVTIAATRTEMAICVAPNLYIYDGSSTTQVTDPDLPNVTSVTAINQRFIISTDDDKYYWSDLLDGSSWDALNFATAEGAPDKIIRVFSDGQRVYAFGSVSTEVIGANTNPPTASEAFSRLGGGVLPKGIAGVHAVAMDQESQLVVFMGDNRVIYATNGYDLSPLSNVYMDSVFEAAAADDIAATRMYSYANDGRVLLVVNVPNVGTFVYNKSVQKWTRRTTQGQTNFRGNMYANVNTQHYVADENGTDIYVMDKAYTDDAGAIISKEFTASIPVRGRGNMRRLVLDAWSDCASKVSMRWTDDGRRWTDWVDRDLRSPDTDGTTEWRKMGKARSPKRIFHFRITDACRFKVRGARINEGVER